MLKAILIIIFAVLAVGGWIAAFWLEKQRAVMALLACILTVAFILVPFSLHQVDVGEVAVVKHLGRAVGVRTPGTYFDFWGTNFYQAYDAKVQNVDIKTVAYSSDAQTMDIDMILQYQISSDSVMEIAQQYGSLNLLQERIVSIAIEKAKSVLSSYAAMDIIANRAAMSPEVEEIIRSSISDDYYVNITAVVLTNIDFSDAFENAVENKMIAEQQQLKAEYENKTKIAQAEADAKAKLINVEADAKAKVVEAEAEAEANKLLEKSLTDKVLRNMYIEKWDGVLPQTVVGDDTAVMIPIQGGNTND